jgi:hypothetical protein
MGMTKELAPLAAKFLDIIAGAGDWMSRKQLAAAIGRKRLTPHDIDTLEMLTHAGYIEAEKHTTGVVLYEFRYRIPKND